MSLRCITSRGVVQGGPNALNFWINENNCVSLPLFLTMSDWGNRALEERCIGTKSPSRVQDQTSRVAGRNGREKCFPDKWSLIYLPFGHINGSEDPSNIKIACAFPDYEYTNVV